MLSRSGFLDFIEKQKYASYLEFFKTGTIDMNILREMMKLLGHYTLKNIYNNEDVENLYFEYLVMSPRSCYIFHSTMILRSMKNL